MTTPAQRRGRRRLGEPFGRPAATQVADQCDRVDQARLRDAERVLLVGELHRLCLGDGRVVDGASPVLGKRDRGAADGIAHRDVQGLRLFTEDPQAREIVLDALERVEHRAPIARDRRLVRRARRAHARAPAAEVEQRLGAARADRPDAARRVQQPVERRLREAGRRRQRQIRVVSGDLDADRGILGRHRPLGGGDVGPALQQ